MVGYYHSNQCIANELEPEPIAKKIADRLNNELNNMCFLMVKFPIIYIYIYSSSILSIFFFIDSYL